jgi:hypothetical protein
MADGLGAVPALSRACGMITAAQCPLYEAGLTGECGRCFHDPEAFGECCDEAAWWESLLNPQSVDLEEDNE